MKFKEFINYDVSDLEKFCGNKEVVSVSTSISVEKGLITRIALIGYYEKPAIEVKAVDLKEIAKELEEVSFVEKAEIIAEAENKKPAKKKATKPKKAAKPKK